MDFPLLDSDFLKQLPKAGKREDIRRIWNEPNSEDYVTWNVMALLKRIAPDQWWPRLVDLARSDNSLVPADLSAERVEPKLWHLVRSPTGYESASRSRMAGSQDELSRRRSRSPKPVEGESEIDLLFRSDCSLIFVEAKLTSDISSRTTYDSSRNQIARNIDCLLESAGSARPFFWMFAKDRSPKRKYMKLIRSYHKDPTQLRLLLPHRDTDGRIDEVVRRIAVLQWTDIIAVIDDLFRSTDENVAEVLQELRRRCQSECSEGSHSRSRDRTNYSA